MSQFGKQRGNKLWERSRMIIPEHRARMVEHEIQQERFVERPELDDEQLQEMSRILAEAIRDGRVVTLKVYHQYGAQEVTMLPVRIDPVERKLHGKNADGKVRVSLGDVLGVE